ncbi:type VI secretion system baseplate subunit TssG [Sodalis ligni]|uniref:type VI secretion system baseplate subunit TssG n=1 Tax=Sodalis ligni TaxID=2697027 RepID=UPI00193FD1FF|nr:type VI secretion system baseplate subunit TssG [Sodalis ligni]QWA11547.1 type VI secretion system baseplate subunit TssG [Sodalis ligni]
MKINCLRRLCPAPHYRRLPVKQAAGPYRTAPCGENDDWMARAEQPWRYDLFQLLRRVDAEAGAHYPLGRAPLPRHEPVRMGQRPSLGFASAAIAAISPMSDSRRRRIDIHGFGLFGPNGPLPLHITEYAYQRRRQYKDTSLAAFADIFHHRLILLFYRAWADAQHCVSFDRPDNRRFDHYAACLLGLGHIAGHGDMPGLPSRYFMAGHLTRHPRNAAGLASIIRHSFSVPVHIHENLFHWLALPRATQLRLQKRGAPALGKRCCLGTAIADRQCKFQLVIGPLSWRTYRQLLPSAPNGEPCRTGRLAELRRWVAHYAGIEYIWELKLVLAKEHYRGCVLGRRHPLGQGCWLGLNSGHSNRDDFYFCPEPFLNV